jgi:hypothetical protein
MKLLLRLVGSDGLCRGERLGTASTSQLPVVAAVEGSSPPTYLLLDLARPRLIM